ncbi:MAG TPA: peptidase M36, partial [Micromonosporaceae bacterium]|nr:peptidase M36 [Micromonosporaceae bacterium]
MYLAVVAMALASGTAAAGPAAAAPATPNPSAGSPDVRGDSHQPRDKDNRTGTAVPSATQLSLAPTARWNTLGTPAALGPKATGLATGLSADPETAARQYLTLSRELFGLDQAAVAAMDQLLVDPIGTGAVVLLRQRFGDLPAGHDGLVAVLVRDGTVLHVTSSLARDTRAPEAATISADDAYRAALADAGLAADQVAGHDVSLVAVPTPADGPRAAYAVTLSSTDLDTPVAFTTYVDGRTGAVLVRDDLVDFDSDNPKWAAFEATPAAGPRVIWCLTAAPGCVREVRDPASGQAWDVDLATGLPTFTSNGNSARDVLNWGGGNPATLATASPTRDYTYALTDQWHAAQCDPAVFTSATRNDADAAIGNLFAMHNRMHDFAYRL